MKRVSRRASGLAIAAAVGCADTSAPAGESSDTTAGSTAGSSSATGADDADAASADPSSNSVGDTTSATDDPTAGTEETADSTSNDSTGGGPFELEVHTELTDDGRLALRCNLPPRVEDCALIDGAPCEDLDADGLSDTWEDVALERLRPVRRLDEAEPLIDDATTVLGDVGRVVLVGDNFRIFVMLGYHLDYGSCGVSGHSGDSERVALDLMPWLDAGAGGVSVVGAYTAAHENTATDNGQVYTGPELDDLVFDLDPRYGEPRWIVFPSAGKHATYASAEICEAISAIPCLDEDCGPDGVANPADFDRLPMVVNAGEEAAPRVTDLTDLGFPGDDAWAMQDFCGGQGGTGCTSPVREKLLVDPF